jgi:hypothetical protein
MLQGGKFDCVEERGWVQWGRKVHVWPYGMILMHTTRSSTSNACPQAQRPGHLMHRTICCCCVGCRCVCRSTWSPCDTPCGPGTQTRVRYTMPPSLQSSSPACSSSAFVQQQACTGAVASCPSSCAYGAWSGFGACSRTCGGGTQYRTRALTAGVASCGPLISVQLCNTQACA